jgi:copper chaperone
VSQYIETRDYTVEGMTCSHCVLSVREEVSEVAGVSAVDVDLASGRLTVTGDEISDDAIRDAVAEAGYQVAGIHVPTTTRSAA